MSRLLMAALLSGALGMSAPIGRMMASIPNRVPPKPITAADEEAIERARKKRERRSEKRRNRA